jgi:zinc protease
MKTLWTAFTMLAAAAASAQPVDRTKPPQTPPIPDYKLAATYETKLPNGLAIVLVEDRRFPLVTARLAFLAGAKYDPPGMPGLSGNLAALLTEGTKSRTSKQIAEEITSMGGDLGGQSGADGLTLSGNALSENFSKLLNLMSDCAINASFPDDEVQLRKQNGKQELTASLAQPSFLARREFGKRVFGDHPYGQSNTLESFDKLDKQALVDFRDKYMAPNNATLILVGQLPSRTETLNLIKREFGSWKQVAAASDPAAKFPEPTRQLVLVNRPGSVQADVHIGRLAATRSSNDYYPEAVGNMILGGAFDSRFFNDIREKQGFAYDAHSEVTPRKDTATFTGVMQVRNEVVQPAIQSMLDHMTQIAKERVSAEELSSAKNFIAGIYILQLETQNGLASQIGSVRIAGLPITYLENYVTRIRQVEPDQLQKVAAKYFDPAHAAIVVVGDAAKIQPSLEKFGPVQVVPAK